LIARHNHQNLELSSVSLGPHCAYFRMRTLKPQVAKVSTVHVEKTINTSANHICRRHLIGW